MLLNTDYFLPSTLTGYARSALRDFPVNKFALAQWLPHAPIDDLVYRFTRGGGGLLSAAPYRAFDAESSIAKRVGVTRVSGELLPISQKLLLTEYDRLRQRVNSDQAIQNVIMSDTERVTRQIATRLELARGDALVNGSVTLNENGVVASVSFGRDSSMSVTANTLWSTTATADPIGDLVTWVQAYIDRNGSTPEVLLTSTRVRGLLQRNDAIRAEASTLAGTPTIVSVDMLDRVLTNYALPPLRTYDVHYDLNGTSTRVIADNIALLLPAAGDPNDANSTDLGATFVGTTAESLDPSYALTGDEAGIVAGVYREEDPISLWTKAAAIALPVLANPDLAMKATVAS